MSTPHEKLNTGHSNASGDDLKHTQQRSLAQNRALHKWFSEIAEVLKKEGKSMYAILDKMKANEFFVEAMPTKNLIKEGVWKVFQEAILGKEHTSDLLKTGEIDDVKEPFIKFFAEEMQVQVPPFPSFDEQNLRKTYK